MCLLVWMKAYLNRSVSGCHAAASNSASHSAGIWLSVKLACVSMLELFTPSSRGCGLNHRFTLSWLWLLGRFYRLRLSRRDFRRCFGNEQRLRLADHEVIHVPIVIVLIPTFVGLRCGGMCRLSQL